MDKTLLSILAGLGGMVGWGTSDFFANISSDKVGHLKTFFWSQLAGIVLTLILIPIFGFYSNITFIFGFFVILASLFYSAGYLLFYKAFEIGNVSIVAASINLYVILSMIIAAIFSKQTLTTSQGIAITLVLTGVTLVSINFEDLRSKKIKLFAGIKEVLFASLFFGIFWGMSEHISEKIGWLPTTLYIKFVAIISIFIFAMISKKPLKLSKTESKAWYFIMLVGLLEAGAVASVNFGLEFGDLILVSPISSALSVVTISMAVIFLKEKLSKIQVVGIVTTLVGIILTTI
ncbi:DMT family transporter [Candidatus Woesebacteria bacterium]|nr:DMT family transporter [Candidatus Woesebacteria bacterium]